MSHDMYFKCRECGGDTGSQCISSAGNAWGTLDLNVFQVQGMRGGRWISLCPFVSDTVLPYLSAVMSHLWRDFSLVMRHDKRRFLLEVGDIKDFLPFYRAQVNSKHVPQSQDRRDFGAPAFYGHFWPPRGWS